MNDLKEDVTNTVNDAKDTMTDYGNNSKKDVIGPTLTHSHSDKDHK